MLLMTLGFSIQASLCSRKLLFQRRHSKNWECSCLTWWSKECGKLGKAEKVNSQRPSLKVAVSRNAFWAVFKTALLQEQRAPEAKYLKTDYMYHVQLKSRADFPCFSQPGTHSPATRLGLCLELSMAQPRTTGTAQPREAQQTALGLWLVGQDWRQSQTGKMLMPTYNFHWNTWKWVTPCNTWARKIEKKPTPAYFFICGINYGQLKFFILSTQYRVGKPFYLCASKFSGAFLYLFFF